MDIIGTIDLAGWTFAGFLCLVNIVLVYLIIPAKNKINKLSESFHGCQLKGVKALSQLHNEQIAFKNTTTRHDTVIEDIRDGMKKVEVKLGALEVVADNNGELLKSLDNKIEQLLRNGRK